MVWTTGIVLLVLVPLNLLLIILGFRWFNKIYSQRFDTLTEILDAAVLRQQAELGKFKGMFMKEVLSKDQAFDEFLNLNSLVEGKEEDGHTETTSEGA